MNVLSRQLSLWRQSKTLSVVFEGANQGVDIKKKIKF